MLRSHRPPQTRKGSVRSLFGSIGSLFGSRDNLTTPRKVKALFNVKTTSTKEPDFVLEQLESMLESNQYEVKKKGYDVIWCCLTPVSTLRRQHPRDRWQHPRCRWQHPRYRWTIVPPPPGWLIHLPLFRLIPTHGLSMAP